MARGVYQHTQPNARTFSNLREIGPGVKLICCDCGLTHEIHFYVRPMKTKKALRLFWRIRRHEGITKRERRRPQKWVKA